MNKFRIYAAASIMLSFSGIALMSTEKTAGVAIMILGLIPTIIFLQKAKRKENNPGNKSKQENNLRKQKKTILQYLISKIKENQGIQNKIQDQGQAKKESILQTVIEHFKEKPVTVEEIRQLRLQAEKYRLKADIAKSKAKISGSKGGKFSLGGSDSQEDRISGLLRGAVRTKDVDFFSNSDSKLDLFGNKDSDDKSDREKEAYRKRTLGF